MHPEFVVMHSWGKQCKKNTIKKVAFIKKPGITGFKL